MRILVAMDDAELAQALRNVLQSRNMLVDLVATWSLAKAAVHAVEYRALILDRWLPEGDSLKLVQIVRGLRTWLPILLLGRHNHAADCIACLDAGADDYLPTPFEFDELAARLRAITRRLDADAGHILRIGNFTFDFSNRMALVGGAPLSLPRSQLLLLEALCARQGRIVRHEVLSAAVHLAGADGGTTVLDPHVSRLRRALRSASVSIESKRGLGYMLNDDAA
ncbi:response regulator transcription factor [Stenotrophomonas muris]|uniref:response regulator transcription factor n=1 Tax=Stenotrophomonas muris TaxID=2963283 RepID=UPI001150E0D9|nr:response regulator transcription factor [Stenotrophomonas maltophilia]TQM04820.1 DNA-binding response OmpR family regulator [Stenotrophomonas maltophilia]